VPRAWSTAAPRAIKLVADAHTDKILGVHAVATDAHSYLRIKSELTVTNIADIWASYLTLAEDLKFRRPILQRRIKQLSCYAA
jgi:mercuric reductase